MHVRGLVSPVLSAAVLTLVSTAAALAQEQWSPELALEVRRISNVQVSPDGRRVVFQVAEAIMEGEKSEWLSHLYLGSTNGAPSFQLTQGEKSATAPAWSPDGQWIAFLSSRSDKANIWAIGASGEARQITDVETGVQSFRWSPDGRHIAFLMADPQTEAEEEADREKRDARVVDEDFKMAHLHLVPVSPDKGTQKARRLTEGDFNVGTALGGVAFDWSPGGGSIVFSHTPTPKVDDWTEADVSVVDVESGTVRPLATTGAAENQPTYSPDGRWIAFAVSDDPPSWAFTSRVHVIDAAGGVPRPLADSYDEQPGIVGWTPDGSSILISETQGTMNRLSALPLDGGEPIDISPAEMMVGGAELNATGSHLGFISQSPDTPPEAFVTPSGTFDPVKVSEVQDLPDAPLGRTEVQRWTSTDGTEIEGLLTYPVGYREGTAVPLLVIVHGGPTGVFVHDFIGARGAYPIAAFAARGYAVLRCNVRGSSGYGREFRYANYGDWGGGDYRDIMSGVDALVERGIADPEKLGVMGWSYGGYMTSWIITQTDRFKAASVGAGVNNLMSFTGTADIQGFIPDYFGGDYWDVFDEWREHSAMFNIGGVATPTLIQHGEADARVPVTQGYELYHAIKRQGVPTKMVVYPRQPHGIREPKLQLDAMWRNIEWFDQWVMGRGRETTDGER
jgi:dipeptidyl aminopeptidase/acylaminoacyl peptidase